MLHPCIQAVFLPLLNERSSLDRLHAARHCRILAHPVVMVSPPIIEHKPNPTQGAIRRRPRPKPLFTVLQFLSKSRDRWFYCGMWMNAGRIFASSSGVMAGWLSFKTARPDGGAVWSGFIISLTSFEESPRATRSLCHFFTTPNCRRPSLLSKLNRNRHCDSNAGNKTNTSAQIVREFSLFYPSLET
jgi:hypothetical protein